MPTHGATRTCDRKIARAVQAKTASFAQTTIFSNSCARTNEMIQPAKLALEDGTVFTGTAFGANRRSRRRGLLQHLDDRLSGNPHRSKLPRPDRRDDVSGNRQLRRQRRGCRKRPAASGGLHRAATEPPGQQFPRDRRTRTTIWPDAGVVGTGRHRHAGAGAAHSQPRRACKGVLSTIDLEDEMPGRKGPKASPGLVGRDLVREVIPSQPRDWQERLSPWARAIRRHPDGNSVEPPSESANSAGPHVVAIDYGMKWNIARHLAEMGCRVTILPGTASADEILGASARRRVPFQRPRRSRAAGRTRSTPFAACWARRRYSASAWGTNCSRWPAGQERSS